MNIAALRAQIPALSQAIYLNTGTFGPSPSAVLDEIREALDLIEQHGAYAPPVRERLEREAYERARLDAAALVGATADELVLTRSVSDGICTVAYGLDWRTGDEVVISDQEHPSGVLPWLTLARRAGIKVRVAATDEDPAVVLQHFADQLSPRTRLVFASHVSCLNGMRLPVREICALAHGRGALAVVDGAHAVGQFPVNVREIGCDAYATCGHKWLLGPQGTSFTYIAREHLSTFQPSWIGWGAQDECSLDLGAQTFALHDSARRFEFGTKQWPLFPGLGRAIRFIDGVGLPAIEARVRPLATRLKQAIDEIPQLRRLTPLEPALSAGIVSLRLRGGAPDDVKAICWERHRLIVAYDMLHQSLRLSVAFFTTESEVDQALAAIAELAG